MNSKQRSVLLSTWCPPEQLDDSLSVFEEARYSDHTIDASHRDRAMRTLDAITRSLTVSLGEGGMVERKELVNLL